MFNHLKILDVLGGLGARASALQELNRTQQFCSCFRHSRFGAPGACQDTSVLFAFGFGDPAGELRILDSWEQYSKATSFLVLLEQNLAQVRNAFRKIIWFPKTTSLCVCRTVAGDELPPYGELNAVIRKLFSVR